jgi:hypothetical protein
MKSTDGMPKQAYIGGGVYTNPFAIQHYKGISGQRHASASLPTVMTRYPLYRRFRGPLCQSGHHKKSRPLTGTDPLNVQVEASRNTDTAIRTAFTTEILHQNNSNTEHILTGRSFNSTFTRFKQKYNFKLHGFTSLQVPLAIMPRHWQWRLWPYNTVFLQRISFWSLHEQSY